MLSLHRRFDPSEAGPSNEHFVRGENESQTFPLGFMSELSKGKLIKREQQGAFSRHFDPDAASVRVAGPAFG